MADAEPQNQAENTDGGDGIKEKIFVKSLNGSKQEYKVDLKNDSVRDLKTKLQEREGIPQEQLRIIFRGKLLLDGGILLRFCVAILSANLALLLIIRLKARSYFA